MVNQETINEIKDSQEKIEIPKTEKEFLAISRSLNIIESEHKQRHEQLNLVTTESDELLQRTLKAGITSDNLQGVPDETIDKLYKPTNGDPEIILELPLDNEKKIKEFKKSFIGLLIINHEADKVYETEVARLNEEIAKDMEDFKKAVGEYGSFHNYVLSELEYNSENAKTKEERDRQKKLLKYFNYAETSENILDAIQKCNPANFMSDYQNETKQVEVYSRYLKIVKKMQNNIDLTKYPNIEDHIEGYEQYLNLFVFAVMRTIAYEKDSSQEQAFYLANLAMVIQEFLAGSLEENRKERFVTGVKAVIDYFVK